MTQVGKNLLFEVLPIQGVLLALPPGPRQTSNSAINNSFDVVSILDYRYDTSYSNPISISSLPLFIKFPTSPPLTPHLHGYMLKLQISLTLPLRMPAALASFLAQS